MCEHHQRLGRQRGRQRIDVAPVRRRAPQPRVSGRSREFLSDEWPTGSRAPRLEADPAPKRITRSAVAKTVPEVVVNPTPTQAPAAGNSAEATLPRQEAQPASQAEWQQPNKKTPTTTRRATRSEIIGVLQSIFDEHQRVPARSSGRTRGAEKNTQRRDEFERSSVVKLAQALGIEDFPTAMDSVMARAHEVGDKARAAAGGIALPTFLDANSQTRKPIGRIFQGKKRRR